jgi:thioesterase domain-containing protein
MLAPIVSSDGTILDCDCRGKCTAIKNTKSILINKVPLNQQNHTNEQRITVFLMPGVHYHDLSGYKKKQRAGELLGLARFRSILHDQIRFVLIRYPNWQEMIAIKLDFAVVVASALEQILGECAGGPVYLAGHSFGGLVAYDTARRLVESGRQVAFLGLLDTWLCDAASSKSAASRFKDFLRWKDVHALLRLMLRILIALRAYKILTRVARVCMRLGGLSTGAQITAVLRFYSVRNWRSSPISVPTFLFRCEDGPADYGWGVLCSRLHVISVGGNHITMLSAKHVHRLAGEFANALSATVPEN